jgi:hypothetical protein
MSRAGVLVYGYEDDEGREGRCTQYSPIGKAATVAVRARADTTTETRMVMILGYM